MKRLSFGTSVAALLMMTGAAAAAGPGILDNGAPTGNWTGFYAGGSVGYGFGGATDSLNCDIFDGVTLGSISWLAGEGVGCNGDPSQVVAITALHNEDGAPWYTDDNLSDLAGWLAGGQFGYNQQMGSLVFGAEVTGSLANISDTGVTEITELNDVTPSELGEFGGIYEGELDINWIATATGKLGFALGDNMLVSAVGGLALAGTTLSSSAGYSDDQVASGFTVGGQIEYKLSDNVSAFGAYNHMWFNDVSYEGNSLAGLIANFHEYDIQLDIVKVGLNYHFN